MRENKVGYFMFMFRTILVLFFVLPVIYTHASEQSKLKNEIAKFLKENPDLVLQILRENDMAILDLLERASQKRYMMQEEARMEKSFEKPLTPEIELTRAIRGNKNAKITIVEYSDFQCPYCSRAYYTVNELLKKYAGKVRLVYKHLPLDMHSQAMSAAQYFEAITKQDPEKAWKFHDIIFENPAVLKNGEQGLLQTVASLGLDQKQLKKALKSKNIKAQIEKDVIEAKKFGFNGTPSFLINGIPLRGAHPQESFSKIIDKLLTKAK